MDFGCQFEYFNRTIQLIKGNFDIFRTDLHILIYESEKSFANEVGIQGNSQSKKK
jgi:hypothetical protein